MGELYRQCVSSQTKEIDFTMDLSLLFSLCFCFMFLFAFVVNVQAQVVVFDVVRYGAVADGKTDNTKVG